MGFISKQFPDRLRAVIDQRKRARLRAGQMGFQIQPETMINGRHNFSRFDRALDRISANLVALAHDSSAFDAASGKVSRPALRPMVASAGGIDLGRAAELS